MPGFAALITFFVVKYGMKKKTIPALVAAFVVGSVVLVVIQFAK